MLPPYFNHDLRLLQCVEDFTVQQFIAQLSIEAFAISILPRTSWFDVSGLGPHGSDPVSKSDSDELGAIVRTNVCGNTPRDEQIAERLDHVSCLELARDSYLKSRGCRIGGVTLGERGLIWYDDKGAVRTLPALVVPSDRILDTSGAGDVFHGAYIHS